MEAILLKTNEDKQFESQFEAVKMQFVTVISLASDFKITSSELRIKLADSILILYHRNFFVQK